ncbi:hypothetical protein NYG90_08260 [Helicobacter sp. XJK30-2]|uniref:Uncharacterized protein n=1 Tax=Helicobacter zhangjianzhongii TaxID=2974574 RepID=A0ACC6FUQ4_9HELI|nr:hypothetical protein [Helicobacter sp. XJK30-2]MDL0082658.1 hypothetical protein [Helicobacter sp. XJK30-2]
MDSRKQAQILSSRALRHATPSVIASKRGSDCVAIHISAQADSRKC